MKLLPILLAAWSLAATAFGADTNSIYVALPLGDNGQGQKTVDKYGIPFVEGQLPLEEGGLAEVNVGGKVERIFLLGMTDRNLPEIMERQKRTGPSEVIRPASAMDAWADPRDQSVRFFVGDDLGQIRINYANGTTQVFPLTLGESIWWGRLFYDYQEPFPTDAHLRTALAGALRLYPPAPVEDGNYVAVIEPKALAIKSITFENSPDKKGIVSISGITVESAGDDEIKGTPLEAKTFSPEFAKFIEQKPLRAQGEEERQVKRELKELSLALYSSDESFKGSVAPKMPPGYNGPTISFKGNLGAEVLVNVFYDNVQDIRNKIDDTGMYHTSTRNALSWGSYKGFGTFRENFGRYYGDSFSRDQGRSLQEITMLDFTNDAERCADYSLARAGLWATEPSLKELGRPPHWGMFVNRASKGSLENDGEGLMMMFIFKLWQRLPDRDEWLRAHWTDVKGQGDWILWQLAHPEISGATNGVLHTTGESAGGSGYSVYPDTICMDGLRAFAQMADSLGETNSAAQWRTCADKMQSAIAAQYIVEDQKYGRVWTLDHSGWPDHSTVLGPLIFLADYQGFAPENEFDNWHLVNEATYHRLIDTYSTTVIYGRAVHGVPPAAVTNIVEPFGFYGQAMGYGQGFVTESALLLDRMQDATTMLDWTAKEVYDPRYVAYDHFIVPEGVEIEPTGEFWYRIGDLGNGVQEGEIVKVLRLVIGVDDSRPHRLQFYPRMPYGWSEMAVSDYPVLFENYGNMRTGHLSYKLERSGIEHSGKEMKLTISADQEIGPVAMRLGPFEKQPEVSRVRVNGKTPRGALVEHSGDSWWIRFTMRVGPSK